MDIKQVQWKFIDPQADHMKSVLVHIAVGSYNDNKCISTKYTNADDDAHWQNAGRKKHCVLIIMLYFNFTFT